MKRNRLINLFVLAFGASAFLMMPGCSKEGPAGPAGSDGTPGVAGNAVCMECHNLDKKAEVNDQYMESQHGEGEFVGYAGGRNSCAKCHSDQGFKETQYTGQDTTIANISLPQPVQCETCHDFHETLDFSMGADYALRTNDPVDLLMYRAADPDAPAVTLDLDPSSNLCANCHQPRRVGPVDDGTGMFTVTSTHYGPHHGPQSLTLGGFGAYELGTGYPAPGTGGMHVEKAGCTTCHMHDGNHSMNVTLEGCNTSKCHNGSITTFENNNRQMQVAALLTTLETKLTDAGLILDGHPNPGTYPVDEVGALYNYEWVLDDRSMGVHNFQYIETLLNNSIAVFP